MTISIDLNELAPQLRYKLLTGIIVPRPIAWITSQNEGGLVNAAPFSFFNLFGQYPALVILGLEHSREGGGPKDTARNIAAAKEFVVNIVTADLLEPMVDSAAAHASNVSEPDLLGLKLAPSTKIGTPRLTAAPVAIECKLKDTLRYSDERDIVIGEAVALVAREGLIDTTKMHVNWEGHFPIARLFADRYALLAEINQKPIPELREYS